MSGFPHSALFFEVHPYCSILSAENHSVVWIFHYLPTQAPHNGHVGTSHILAIVSRLLWTCVCRYFSERLFSTLQGIHLGGELQGHVVVVPRLTFQGPTKLFPTAVGAFRILVSKAWGFPFSTFSQHCYFLGGGGHVAIHDSGSEVGPHDGKTTTF